MGTFKDILCWKLGLGLRGFVNYLLKNIMRIIITITEWWKKRIKQQELQYQTRATYHWAIQNKVNCPNIKLLIDTVWLCPWEKSQLCALPCENDQWHICYFKLMGICRSIKQHAITHMTLADTEATTLPKYWRNKNKNKNNNNK